MAVMAVLSQRNLPLRLRSAKLVLVVLATRVSLAIWVAKLVHLA
jgi:hypothetical protein